MGWKYCVGSEVAVGVLLQEEAEEMLDGEECRALGRAQKEWRLDCWLLDWELEGSEETGS
jgi:hypothetical protein